MVQFNMLENRSQLNDGVFRYSSRWRTHKWFTLGAFQHLNETTNLFIINKEVVKKYVKIIKEHYKSQ